MPFSRSAFSDSFTHSCSRVFVPVYFSCSAIAFSTVEAATRTSEPFGAINLCVNVTRGTMYHQASCAQLLELAACAGRTTDTSRFLIHSVTLLLLSLFGTHDFVGVTNTLAFIRLRTTGRRADPLQPGRYLLISAFQHDFSLSRDIQQ
ncbi:Uncharacterised protein [Escherichia coli]|uniref:Uncharacterized protein n=1 Tax=Escherichia coli TaxID=562 RepID=A0A2X1NA10_ECOLX|nr:Uncharacterised protein [Escherichia coli]